MNTTLIALSIWGLITGAILVYVWRHLIDRKRMGIARPGWVFWAITVGLPIRQSNSRPLNLDTS